MTSQVQFWKFVAENRGGREISVASGGGTMSRHMATIKPDAPEALFILFGLSSAVPHPGIQAPANLLFIAARRIDSGAGANV